MVFWSLISRKLIFILLCFCFFSFGMTGCTSSDDDDVSVLEDGLEDFDTEIDSDLSDENDEELADLDEDDDEGDDEDDEDEEFEDDEETELAQLDDEFSDEDDEDDDDEFDEDDDDDDDEFADLDDEDDDDEFDEDDDDDDDDDEFADLDEDDDDDEFDEDDDDDEFDDDDDEFAEFDDEDDDDDEFAQNEDSLGEELKQGEEAQEGESEFPEQVVGQEGGADPSAGENTSETQDITVGQTEDPSLPQDDLGQADPISPDDEGQEETPRWIPVVKIKTDPEFKNGRLINGVYIVRPQDTMESISEKIYGDGNKAEELNAGNPHLAKGIDPGDKVYYNSPNRPDDKSHLKIFYEDIGLEPQVYVTKENDNMRRLGSRLLGFADGWKEIWAINQNVDSKTILPGGLQLRYWTGSESPLNVADVNLEDESPSSGQGSKEESDDIPVDEPEDIAAVGKVEPPLPAEPDIPAEPPLPEPQMNMPENDLEPVADVEAFPESEEQMESDSPKEVSAAEPESLVSVGALALILLAGLILVVIQIKKRSSATALHPSSLEYTQV